MIFVTIWGIRFLFLLSLWYNSRVFDPLEGNVSLIRDFIELITNQPGALVYHLVILFAIQLIAGVAIGHWRRQRDEAATRLLAMGIALFLARAVLMLTGVLDSVGLVSSTVVFPPLERFLHLITALLVIWAFLPILQQNAHLGTQLLIVTVLIAAGTYAAFASLWPEAEAHGIVYNSYWQERVWEVSSIAILGLAFVANLAWRGSDWGWLACLLALWLAGHFLQFAAPATTAHTAGWVRLGNLAALPLLAALVYRRALAAAGLPVSEEKETSPAALSILEAVQRIGANGELKPGLEMAIPAVARTVNADMAAVGLLVPGPVQALRVIALHPTTSVMAAHQEPTLLLSKHPLLSVAQRNGRLERVPGERGRALRVNGLYRRLGFDESGPLLIQPLVNDDAVLGLLLVGNPDSQREWNPRDEEILQAIAYVLAPFVARDGDREPVSNEKLVHVQEEVERMTSHAEDLEARLERERRRSEALSTRLRLREKEIAKREQASAALSIWQEEVRQLAQARDALQGELSQWQERAEQLSEVKGELERQLSEARTSTTSSADSCFAGTLLSDGQGTILLASRNVQQLLEESHDELMATPIQELFDEPWWVNTVKRLLKDSSQAGTVTTVSLDLGDRMVRVELTRLPANDHWPGALIALFYLPEGATVERNMIASLVQELRTPMTSITGYTDLLLGEKLGILGESQRRLLLRVEANIERMERLLDDLIKATDIDSGQITLLPEPVAVDKVIKHALDILAARFDEKDLDVDLDLPPELPPAHADRDSLQQVVLNLLSNAALASEPGTEVRIDVGIEERPDDLEGLPAYVLVSVTDTGGGIAPEDRRRVFRRFYRADTPLIPGLGDTGVGLSVAKALVEANHGRIWVDGETDAGSTFSFMLPLSPPNGA